jgi:hypothetical protein
MTRVTNIARSGNTTKINVIQNVLALSVRFIKAIMPNLHGANPLVELFKNGTPPTDQSMLSLAPWFQPGGRRPPNVPQPFQRS